MELISEYDVIVDASDNAPTRYLIRCAPAASVPALWLVQPHGTSCISTQEWLGALGLVLVACALQLCPRYALSTVMRAAWPSGRWCRELPLAQMAS